MMHRCLFQVLKRRRSGRESADLRGSIISPYISPLHDGSSVSVLSPPVPPAHTSYTNIPIQRTLREIERLERIPGAQKIDLYKVQ